MLGVHTREPTVNNFYAGSQLKQHILICMGKLCLLAVLCFKLGDNVDSIIISSSVHRLHFFYLF